MKSLESVRVMHFERRNVRACPSNPERHVSATKFPLLDRRGGCAIKKMVPFLSGADGVVDQEPKSKRSATRSKTIARVFPSCPGGEIGANAAQFRSSNVTAIRRLKPGDGRLSPLRGSETRASDV